jgi:DNA repair protein SbcC/Rad50
LWELKQEEYKDKIQKTNEEMSEYRISENGIMSELKVNREGYEQLKNSFEEATKLSVEKQKTYLEFLQMHKIQSVDAELKILSENDRKMNEQQKLMEQTQENINSKRALLGRYREEFQLINADIIKVEADLINLNTQKSDKEKKLKELAGDANIEEEIKRIGEKLNEYELLQNQYYKDLQQLEAKHNNLEAQRLLLVNQKSIYSESLKNEDNRLNAVLVEKGFTDCSEVETSIITIENQEILKIEIRDYDQTGLNIQAQRGHVQKKLKSRTITEEEWNQTSNDYQELAVLKEECVSNSEVTKNNFSNLKNKHEKWMGLNKSYNEVSYKQGLFEQIQKLLKAEHGRDNSFIDYIAEERLRYVAAKASETLRFMTKDKYELQLDTENGFIIRDNANGGVNRKITSLSGGETFLTSLALALALSEQIQLKGQSPLEFFFLDEGFGTLDTDLLDTVIDSLERLSSKERVIGLISHVPELKSRIGRRLIISAPTAQGDGSMVKVEKG